MPSVGAVGAESSVSIEFGVSAWRLRVRVSSDSRWLIRRNSAVDCAGPNPDWDLIVATLDFRPLIRIAWLASSKLLREESSALSSVRYLGWSSDGTNLDFRASA